MQEVIYVLWRDFSQFEGRSSERTWVYRVATNAMLMLKRKQLRTLTSEPIEDVDKNLSAGNDDIENESLLPITATAPFGSSSTMTSKNAITF